MDEGSCVLISVTGVDADGDVVSLHTRGTLIVQDDAWFLRYEEMNPADTSHTETLVQCEGSRVTIMRTGTLLSTIVYDLHETFVGEYTTPFGSFHLRIYASEVSAKRRGLTGRIRLAYQISVSGALPASDETTTRTLDIRFSPCKR